MRAPLRIAILCHSTNPRGGVVHALELGDALARLGHAPTVLAPAGAGFFRKTLCETVVIPARSFSGGVLEMAEARIADYLAWFDAPSRRGFDLFHAQDSISGNALATLKEQGAIDRFARTVHHVDAFSSPALEALQRRAIVSADVHFAVSETWRAQLSGAYGLKPVVVGNGVDADRFSPIADGREAALRARLGLGSGPVVLSVGGVESRKNSRRILAAFRQLALMLPGAQLVIAGGVSLLDHSEYRRAFAQERAEAGLPPDAVVLAGFVPDADMPALYRVADVLAFPSLVEGFGLAALEALASGLPVVASRIAPFTEYLGDSDVAWCDPLNEASIANALMAALAEPLRSRLAARGPAVASSRGWGAVAAAHLPAYRRLAELAHA